MRSMMARVGPTFGPQLAARPRMAGVVKLPSQPAGEVQPAGLSIGTNALVGDVRIGTHNIVYRDARGATRSGRAMVMTSQPAIVNGRKVLGQVTGYRVTRPDGSTFVVRPADIIVATPVDQIDVVDPVTGRPFNVGNQRPGGEVQPVGEAQPAGFSGNPDDYSGAEYDYSRDFTGGGPMTEEQYLASQEALGQVPGAPTQGMSDRVMGQLFTGIGTIIGGTITGVVDAIRSGNAVEIARINAATAQYIADARARGNMEQAAAAQRLQAATSRENVQYIREPPPPATGMSTGTMVAIGVGAVLVLGLGALFVMKKRGRKNPVISDGTRRFFAQPDVAVKYLNEGFSVVGKTSSSRRRRRAAK